MAYSHTSCTLVQEGLAYVPTQQAAQATGRAGEEDLVLAAGNTVAREVVFLWHLPVGRRAERSCAGPLETALALTQPASRSAVRTGGVAD